MKQLSQKLKDGKLNIIESPVPSQQSGYLVIKNHYSLISAGTEGSTVKTARKGYIGKAQERPQQVKQVIDTLKSQGPVQTYRAVMKKLDAYSPLGYSCAGEVIEVGPNVEGFKIGDMVACGGLTACHAEVVSVPKNLCVKLDINADMKKAAYNTLGAIALQGIRQADLRLGESCAIIGMGLLGQITALMLQASGVKTIGIDIDSKMVEIGKQHCLNLGFARDEAGIEEKVIEFTNGIGCDAVIITAATPSLDPINFAGAISRKKGKVIVVGAVPTGFDREPHYYKKELELKMSCSYGPGRYDLEYEEKGIDYPAPYVRWTENRNMQTFQDLVSSGKIDVSYLTTHCFKVDEAPIAYDMITNRTEPHIGILIEYDTKKEIGSKTINLKQPSQSNDQVGIGFIGAGSFAQSFLLPNIPKEKYISMKGVKTATSAGTRSVADRFGFEFCTSDEKEIIESSNINTIFIASRHDSHGQYVLEALKKKKHVFVEKPICLEEEELDEIRNTYIGESKLMVGFNRRFSPLSQKLKKQFGDGTMSMIYRINAGFIPKSSWIQDIEIGGGRILGEVCHFVDYLTFLNGSLPISVYATVMEDSSNFNDILNVSLTYQNGSIGTISYYSNGSKSLPKEYIEVYKNGNTAVLDDFKALKLYGKGKPSIKKLMSQDKGQKEEVKLFIKSIKDGLEAPISSDEIFNTSQVCFDILKSIQSNQVVKITK